MGTRDGDPKGVVVGWLSDRRESKRLGEMIGHAMSGGTFETACSSSDLVAWFAAEGEVVAQPDPSAISIRLTPKVPIRLPNALVNSGVNAVGGITTLMMTGPGHFLATRFTISHRLEEQSGYLNSSAMAPCSRFIQKVYEADSSCRLA